MKSALLALLLLTVGADAQILAVDSVRLTVSDLARSTAFFRDVLAGSAAAPVESTDDGSRTRTVRVRFGDEALDLVEYPDARGRPFPSDLRSNDRSFQHVAIVVRDMRRAFGVLQDQHVTLITAAPERLPDWNPQAAGIEALYFRDPDGHPLEIIHFPAGKGDPKWQRPGGALFLGIDHTAIVVRDTALALVFYRDLLGMRVVGGSENYGPEQERLNVVVGAHLRITTLRAASGFGVELLEYLAPTGGRPLPADDRPNDLLHRETVVRVKASAAAGGGAGSGSSRTTALIRDPDGHAVRIAPQQEEKP